MKSCDGYRLTRLSLSFGGSWGSEEEDFSGGVVNFGSCFLTGSTFGDFSSVLSFSSGGRGVSFQEVSSGGETWASFGTADLDMTATLVPGVTVSPSLAMNYRAPTQ
jgi:hypothetical protein